MTPIARRIGAAGVFLVLVSPAGAQQPAPTEGPAGADLGMRVPAPAPRPEIRLEPTRPRDETGAREQEFHPGVPVRSTHDPAFVTPFVADVPVSPTSKARVGLSGWTAPAVPFDSKDGAGGVAFGLTFSWDVPIRPDQAPEPESPPTGQR
jgi:hypothetical protein